MKQEVVKISAKNLGYLALPDFCPRCFWIKLKMGNKLPWQFFPGIFSSIDSYSKKITWSHYEKFKKVPQWFDEWGKFTGLVSVPHWSKFCIVDGQNGVKVTGIPDDIFVMQDGKLFIVDYKTARLSDLQDALLPMYRVQLNGYALILEKLGMGAVAGLGLVYYEPQGDAPTVNLDTVQREDGFVMPFKAHLKRMELDPEGVVMPLLKEVRRYADMDQAPECRKGCPDCLILKQVIGLVGNIKSPGDIKF